MRNNLSRSLDVEHRQALACCVLLNIWLIAPTTPAVERVIVWLALAVSQYLAAN